MPPRRRPFATAAVFLGTFMATLMISIVSVALPAIQTELHVGLAGLQWILGAYTLCLSAFMLSAGPLADRYGRKRTWLAGVITFIFGSAIAAATHALAVLIAGCALQGIGGALVIPGALSILTQMYPDPEDRARVIGGWSSFSAASLILGPLLGGLLVDHAGWPSIFLVDLPVGLVALGLGLWSLHESTDPDHAALDLAGQMLSVVFLGALTFALINAGQAGWRDAGTLASFLVSALAFVLFLRVEIRAARPVLPIDLLRQQAFVSANGASFVLGFSGYTSLFLFSLFLQQGQGRTATEAGWCMAPVFGAMLVASAFFGRLVRRSGMHQPMIVGYALLGGSMLAMASFTRQTPYGMIAPTFTLLGVALGLAVPATGAAAMASAPRERTGVASATMNTLRQGGMTIGIALLGTLMSARAAGQLAHDLAAASGSEAAAITDRAVQRHELPTDLPMAPQAFRLLLEEAWAGGFNLAATVAGTLALAAALMLFNADRRADTVGRSGRGGSAPPSLP